MFFILQIFALGYYDYEVKACAYQKCWLKQVKASAYQKYCFGLKTWVLSVLKLNDSMRSSYS